MQILTSISLKSKMTLAVSLLVSVILILAGSLTYYFWRVELKKTISTQQNALVSALALQLDDKLLSAQEQLKHFSRRLDRSVMDNPHRFQAIMKDEDDVSVLFNGGLLLISPTGKVIAEYPFSSEHPGRDSSDKEYFKQTIDTGKPVISSPYISTSLKKTTIAFAVPLFAENRSMTAILVGRHLIDSSLIFSSLRELKIGSSGYLCIISENRDIVMHFDPKRIMEVIPKNANTGLEQALKGFEGTIENNNSKGVSGLTSFKHLKSANWVLAANTPLAEAYAPLHRAKLYALFILAGGILLSIIISRTVMARLTEPLHDLTRHVSEFPAKYGNDRIFPVSSPDEIGHLGTAFNGLVTQLDEQNRTIREAADMYRVVAEFNTELAFWRCKNNSIRYISPNCKVITSHSDNEFYASPELMDSLIHPEDKQLWSEHRRDVEQGRTCGPLELRIVLMDGTVKWLSHICHKVFGEQGDPQGIRGSFIDITLIKQMQQAIEDEKKFFGSLIQNTAAPMFVIDRTHTIIFWNNAMARLTGRSSFQMVGTKRQWEPFYPAKRPVLADLVLDNKVQSISEFYADFQSPVFQGGACRAEGWYDNLGGERRYIFFDAAPILNAGKEIVASVETLQDITPRKLAQESMNSHNQELGAVLEQVDLAKKEWEETLDCLKDFVILTDAEHHVRRCNRLLCDMTGKDFNQVIGRDWRDLLSEAGFSFTTFDGDSGELVHNVSQRFYDLNIYTLSDPLSKRTSGLVVSLNDTTEIRSMTEELQRTSKELNETQNRVFQQEKMASIGQLAAGVAHEINNPMGFISSNLGTLNKYVDRLSEYIAAGDQAVANYCDSVEASLLHDLRKRLKIEYIMDDAHQLIAESQDGAGRVRRIVQDLKSFSRVDQAETALINLNEALETTINIAWNEIKYVATLNREFGDIPAIHCFPQQLNQVFLNLLINAAHAMDDGSQGNITIRTWSEEENVFVSVADTGCGIPEEIRQRIFEPFFTTKEVGKGTGLGLSISYDIVHKHGGDITVTSKVGAGTEFTVRLPLNPEIAEKK